MSDTVFVAFDIEKAGQMPLGHPVISIGYCVGDLHGNVLEKDKINLQVNWPVLDEKTNAIVDYGHFEKRCWDEFWSKQPSTLIENLKVGAMPQALGFMKFATWLNGLETKYSKVKFLSDNAEFDIGTLNVNLERYCNRGPLRYTTTGKYRSILPPDDLLDTLDAETVKELTAKHITPYVVHDHDPSNDAEFIYRQYIAFLLR